MTLAFYRQKHVVLTGANRGIGLALAQQLIDAQAHLSVGIRQPNEAKELQALAQKKGSQINILELNITDENSVKNFVAKIPSNQVDVLFNNAGVNLHHDDSASGLSREVLSQTLDVNTLGPIRLIQAIKQHLDRSSTPRIANISSVMGSIGENQMGGSVAYRMSKSALNQYTKCLAIEFEKAIVLALHPGWVQTRMGGPNAQIQTQESARGLLEVVAESQKEQSGEFFRYSGEPIPW